MVWFVTSRLETGNRYNLFYSVIPDLGGNKKVHPVLGGAGDADVCLHVEVVLRAHPEAAGHNSIGRRHGRLHIAVRHGSAHGHDVVGRIGRHRGRHVHVHRSLVRWWRLWKITTIIFGFLREITSGELRHFGEISCIFPINYKEK
jgi:hypothetical protein